VETRVGFTKEELKRRNYLRKLQDKVVNKLLKEGYNWEDKLQGYTRPDGYTISVKDLRDYVFPGFQSDFEYFLGSTSRK
jgi:hypothetical protein